MLNEAKMNIIKKAYDLRKEFNEHFNKWKQDLIVLNYDARNDYEILKDSIDMDEECIKFDLSMILFHINTEEEEADYFKSLESNLKEFENDLEEYKKCFVPARNDN